MFATDNLAQRDGGGIYSAFSNSLVVNESVFSSKFFFSGIAYELFFCQWLLINGGDAT